MIKLLTIKEREVLREVFEVEFESELPNENGHIAAVIEDGKIVAFLTTEFLFRVGLLWVKPSLRKSRKSAKIIAELARYARSSIPPGASAIAIASDEKFSTFFKKLGMRKEDGSVYRIDL